MPLRRLQSDYGALQPEELSFLQGIFDEICVERGAGLEERDAIARKLLRLFRDGVQREQLKVAVATALARSN